MPSFHYVTARSERELSNGHTVTSNPRGGEVQVWVTDRHVLHMTADEADALAHALTISSAGARERTALMDTVEYKADQEARNAPLCICGATKSEHALVCWPHFKGEHGLKHSALSYSAWVARELEAGRFTITQEGR